MKNRGPVFWLLICITFVGMAAAGRILWKRAAYERTNRTVQIAVDLPSLAALLPPGVDTASVTDRLKEIGITTFGVYEFKGRELLANHDILTYRTWPEALETVGMRDPGNTVLTLQGPWTRKFIPNYLNGYFGSGSCTAQNEYCRIPDIGQSLEDLTFGLHAAGIEGNVIPRFFNTPFDNEETIKLKMSALDKLKPTVIVFDGETALGFPKLLNVTAEEISKRPRWSIGVVDMVDQDGVKQLAWKLPGRVVPVHSIPDRELGKNPPAKALVRYRRAVRERGIRFLYVRLYTERFGKSDKAALEDNIEYLEELAKEIKGDGYLIGTVEPLRPFISKPVTRAACVAGAVAFAGLLLLIVFGFPGWLSLFGALASFAIVFAFPHAGAAGMAYKYIIKLAALGTACVVPGLSVGAMFLIKRRMSESDYAPGVGEAAARWAAACALTLAGGIFIAAMLSQREYFLRMDVFSGVKFAFLVPLLLVFLIYLHESGEKLSEFLNSPMRYIEVAIGLVVLAALAVYLIRSGNQATPATAMTDQESALRNGLENLFFARPRFKEFLIGHPALLLVGLIPLGRKKYIGMLLILAGVIGQVSLLNSFCHLHTPILMTYIRSIVGILLGLAIGVGFRLTGLLCLGVLSKKKTL